MESKVLDYLVGIAGNWTAMDMEKQGCETRRSQRGRVGGYDGVG